MSLQDFGLREKVKPSVSAKKKQPRKLPRLDWPFFSRLLALASVLAAFVGVIIILFSVFGSSNSPAGSDFFYLMVGFSVLSGAVVSGALSEISSYLYFIARKMEQSDGLE